MPLIDDDRKLKFVNILHHKLLMLVKFIETEINSQNQKMIEKNI